ncbi:MAG: hypothetical protein ACR2Q3_00905 [Woeseiaceae bacterium]
MSARPVIIYVPGLKPKPEAAVHREQLLRCLRAGLQRVDPDVAAAVTDDDAFNLVSWTYDFYGEHRDIKLDIDDIESILTKNGPSEDDIVAVTSWKRRFTRWLFRTADYLPFLIPHFATEELEIHIRDFNKYLRNNNGVAQDARDKVRHALEQAAAQNRPILLFGHSMGSVIVYEVLWQLARVHKSELQVDLLLTSGSPLGQTFVQRHLVGVKESGADRYPDNIRQWINVAAVGELTALDMQLKNDFGEMVALGLVPDIDDRDTFNYYYMHGSLNVHAEYGYLINKATATAVSEWWRSCPGGF